MKLLLLTSHFPNAANPTRGVFNLQQARALANLCEVRVAAPVQWFPVPLWHGAGPRKAPAYEEIEGLPTWHPSFVLTPGIARVAYPAQMAATLLPALARIRRQYPFDVILATWAFPDVVVGAVAASVWGVPLLAKVHGSDVNVQADFAARRAQILWAMRRAHSVLAVSEALKERLVDIGVPGEKVNVRHNGVDRSLFHPRDRAGARARLGLETEGRHVLFVGNLSEAKAVHVLLQALGKLKAEARLDFTTHLVGGGPLEAPLKRLAASLDLGSSVRFHGRRTHDEIPLWMGASDLLCLPSIREGCPNVILESFASGRPVVATRVGGIPELVAEGCGLLVEPENDVELAEALARGTPQDWDEGAIVRHAGRFSWEEGARALYESAREALQAKQERPQTATSQPDTRLS